MTKIQEIARKQIGVFGRYRVEADGKASPSSPSKKIVEAAKAFANAIVEEGEHQHVGSIINAINQIDLALAFASKAAAMSSAPPPSAQPESEQPDAVAEESEQAESSEKQ